MFFFFKQKTAYEMRISDWSSDVCSSDLRRLAAALPGIGATNRPASQQVRAQYESHPYPRWQAPPTPRPAALRALIASLPGIDRDALPPAPLATLIAGCGTGYEAIDLARTDPSSAITAIDLNDRNSVVKVKSDHVRVTLDGRRSQQK